LDWLSDTLVEAGVKAVAGLLADVAPTTPVAVAEAIAIRLAIHLGDTGAPVNSADAGAWATNRPADWAAFACARALRGDTIARERSVPAARDRRARPVGEE
jgi:hypothetical protein